MIRITKEELDKRLDSPVNVLRGQTTGNGSRTFNDNENLGKPLVKDKETRGLVTAMAVLGGISNTARELGLDRHQVSNISRGLDRDGKKRADRVEEVKAVRESVAEKALDRLMTNLGLMTDDRLKGIPIQELSTITKDLSVVVRNISGDQSPKTNVAQVVLFAPRVREDKEYEAITIEAVAQ